MKTFVSPRSSPLGTFPRETSPAAESEEKRMFSQASLAFLVKCSEIRFDRTFVAGGGSRILQLCKVER